MKYIAKVITDENTGQNYAASIAKNGYFDLTIDTEGEGKIIFYLIKNEAALIAGKKHGMTIPLVIDLSELTTFQALWDEIAQLAITREGSPFQGGTIEDTEA